MLRRLTWYKFTDLSKEPFVSIFKVEEGVPQSLQANSGLEPR
jgi:hypothetical protein